VRRAADDTFATLPIPRGSTMDHSSRLIALKGVQFLASLSDTSLQHLARDCMWRQFEAGEQLVTYQDASTEVYFLTSGKLRVAVYSVEGKAVLFMDLRPGAMFGEIAAIDRAGRSAGVEAIEPSTVASLSANQFERLLIKEPQLALAALKHMAAEVRRLSERVVEFSTLVVQNRIQAELLRLAAEAGQHQSQALLAPTPSLSEIADRISTHREAVSREMSRLASIGLLRREGPNLRIIDVARLARLVREAKGE
jgi:CRP/FNR family transcriptional regulator, cyclic AMP receptor protein